MSASGDPPANDDTKRRIRRLRRALVGADDENIIVAFPLPHGARPADQVSPDDILDPENPLACARKFTEAIWKNGGPTLLFIEGEWWRWRRNHWRRELRENVATQLYQWMAGKYHFKKAGRGEDKGQPEQVQVAPFRPTRHTADEIEFALRTDLTLTDEECPGWIMAT